MTSPLERSALDAAPQLLGAVFRSGDVAVRLTEVEAYLGEGDDPGSHAYRGRTRRNTSMWHEGGVLYVYLSYGIHRCVNVVCGPSGEASAVLLRAGEVVDGIDIARSRRPAARRDVDLARGPGRLGTCLGIDLTDDGASVSRPPFSLELPAESERRITSSARVGVSGPAGTDSYPWRFFLEGDPTVSPFRAAAPRRRPS